MEEETEEFNAQSQEGITQRLSYRSYKSYKDLCTRISLKWKGAIYESEEKKSEVDIEIRITFFHFVPHSINLLGNNCVLLEDT